MSGPPRVKSMMSSLEQEARPVLGPAGNKSRSVEYLRKPIVKLKSGKMQKPQDSDEAKGKKSPAGIEKIPSPVGFRKNVRSILRPNLSMNASCSSDASSTDSSAHSRASTLTPSRRKVNFGSKGIVKNVGAESEDVVLLDGSVVQKRCAWVTSNADPSYVAFHDEEWGHPLHDDKKLFEMLSLSTALAELTWPVMLSKRHTFRDVFLDFDPVVVSKLNDKKIATPGSPASSLLSEQKLRAVIENARQICKIIDEFGSFDKYIWGFVNHKPIVGNFRYPRQVPIKTSKAETISKDLVRRGFRGVGPTVIYSFMQVTGITNDHLINCFRYQDCINAGNFRGKNEGVITSKNEEKSPNDLMELELARDIDDLRLSG